MLTAAGTGHILSGVGNLAEPDVAAVVANLRRHTAHNREQFRHDAPVIVARAAEWVLDNAREIADAVLIENPAVPFSKAMLLEAFNNTVKPWLDADRLLALVREETQPLNLGRPLYPRVVFHNLAGNLFVSGWESLTHAVLLGAASLVRCSDSDRMFPAIWALALTRAHSVVGESISVCEWARDDYARFEIALGQTDAAVCYGGDEAVRALRNVASWNRPFAGHGSTISFALITAEQLRHQPVELLAERCAYDFAVYDQQGCLSPRALFLEDEKSRDVDRFVEGLHAALVNWQKVLPRRHLSLEDAAALARARDGVLLDAACGGPSRRVSADRDPFLITVKPVERFSLGPVDRYVDVYLYKKLDEVAQVLEPLSGRLSTMGVVDPRRSPLTVMDGLGIKRVCELGHMQRPGLNWCLDGYRPLQKMLRFQTVH